MTDVTAAPTRRTVLKSAAWAVPAIAVAVTVPAATASGEKVLGEWRESSLAITQTTINASSPFVYCTRDADGGRVYDAKLWEAQPFEKTVTITYTGSNDDFTFVGASTTSHYTITRVVQRSITLTHTDLNGVACDSGFTGFNLYFNSDSPAGTPRAVIEPGSLLITASATAGDFVVNDIIDVTRCSPYYGEAPRGPREVPALNTDGTCPNGQESSPQV